MLNLPETLMVIYLKQNTFYISYPSKNMELYIRVFSHQEKYQLSNANIFTFGMDVKF